MRETMTAEVFERQFGIKPEKAKELMERLQEIVTKEVREVIENADFYMNPMDYYCDEDSVREEYGDDVFEKNGCSDGYPNLYDYKKQTSAEKCFMDFISYHTRYGGHSSAIDACRFMGIGGWRE